MCTELVTPLSFCDFRLLIDVNERTRYEGLSISALTLAFIGHSLVHVNNSRRELVVAIR